MDKSNAKTDVITNLRKRAEDKMNQRESQLSSLSEIEIKQVVYELGAHQIELEMQNEELRIAQSQIAESRDRYAELYDFAPIGLLAINQHGQIEQANLTALKLFQLEPEQVIERDFCELVLPKDLDEYFVEFRRLSKTAVAGSMELRLARAKGGFFHARVDIGSIRTDGEAGPSRLVSIYDISPQKQAEVERQNTQAQLQHAQRLESLGVLAGGIAHDFNNLLTCIKLHNSVITNSLEPTSELHTNSEQVKMAVQQAAELCQQMLCYAGKSETKIKAFDVSEALRSTTPLLRSSVTKDVRLEVRLTESLPPINGDLTQIQQVMMNLVINACEASKSGNIVSIATSATNALDPSLVNTVMSGPLDSGEYVCIEVVDTGCGISKEAITKIYEPFFSTKFTGRGLGLSVVAGIIRRHNGVISIDSVPGYGTTFRVLLPASAKKTDVPQPEIAIKAVDSGQTPTVTANTGSILVVDDEPAVRNAMRAVLEANNFKVLSAENGEDAVDVFSSHSNVISVILLDLTMPGFTVDETLGAIRAIRNDIPIVIMSGHSEEDVSKLLQERNIAEFLPKPGGNPVKIVQRVFSRTH